MFFEWLQNLMGGSKASPMPRVGQFKPEGVFDSAAHTEAMKRWEFQEQMRQRRQERFAAMAGDPLTPVQVAGGPAPAYQMARFGQPRKWREQIPSILNLRT